jgi:foldase protein PrsA
MGAGTPLSTTNGKTTTKRWWMVIAGTAVVLAAGGVASQFWKSQPGSAAEEAAGSARVSSGAPAQRKPASDRAVARVGKEVITEDVLARECIERHGKEVLEELVNRVIIQQACEAEGKTVTQAEVEAEIVKIAKRFNLDPGEWQKMLQSERNISPQQYRLSVIWPMLALRKLAETSAIDELTEADIVREFERQYGPRVRCRMIMVDNFRRGQEVWKKCVDQPENFAKLAQEFSIDQNSKSLGGAIPPIPRHSGNETVEKEAFSLEENEISALIEVPTPAGARWAILKCEGQTDPVVNDIDQVREELVNELKERRTQESIAKVFERIKSETHVINNLARTNSHPEPNTVNPGAKGAAPQRTSGIRQTSGEKSSGAPAPKPKTANSKSPARN